MNLEELKAKYEAEFERTHPKNFRGCAFTDYTQGENDAYGQICEDLDALEAWRKEQGQ